MIFVWMVLKFGMVYFCCGEVTPLKVNMEPVFVCPLEKESSFGKHHSQVPS